MPENKRFLSVDDLTHMPKPVWLIEGLFEANSLVMVAGPPKSYKSFMALDWMMCMATGRKWCGRVTVPAKVLYVLGEGKASLLKRIQAWTNFFEITPEEVGKLKQNFRVSFEVPQMAMKASVDNLLATLSQEGFCPSVIVVDTLARSFVGMDENSQKDAGVWVESADRLRQLGYTVIFLHHTAKNTDFGHRYRGSSAFMGAVDTAMVMYNEGGRARTVLKVTDQKDHDEGEPMSFQRTIVRTSQEDEGSVVLTPVANLDDRFTAEGRREEELLKTILANESFENDAARARVLSQALHITEVAAKKRISRERERVVTL